MEWYESLFDERYLTFYEELFDTSVAARDVAFAEQALATSPGARWLELGCGFGRHAVEIARRGYEVVGLDRSTSMLRLGARLADEAGVTVRWEPRDLRDTSGLGPFDVCTCLYTAWGYFDDRENEAALRAVREALRQGGLLMLDVTNPIPLLARWPTEIWKEISTGVRRETSRYDAMTARVTTERVLFLAQGGRLELPASVVRMYAPHEVRAVLHR
jgi:SAM-dependent methyltransferase